MLMQLIRAVRSPRLVWIVWLGFFLSLLSCDRGHFWANKLFPVIRQSMDINYQFFDPLISMVDVLSSVVYGRLSNGLIGKIVKEDFSDDNFYEPLHQLVKKGTLSLGKPHLRWDLFWG